VGKYLDIIRARRTTEVTKGNQEDQTFGRIDRLCRTPSALSEASSKPFGRIDRLCRTPSALAEALSELERRCPNFVEPTRWQQAVKDGHRFLSRWGGQAEALGWTPADLFSLHDPPSAKPHPSYSRLSRYDCTGLVWLLDGGQSVVGLTAETATIKTPSGSILTYRRKRA
jgi:hypothetical protein